jgi:DNA-directed RNA polymerase specialized sigma24 family protein
MDQRNGHVARNSLADDELLPLIARITTAAVFAGLAVPDAEDLAQDVFTWLVASGNLEKAHIAPWLAAVTQNFLLRYLRRHWRETRRRACDQGGSACETSAYSDGADAKLFLDRLAARSPLRERRLIELMAGGFRLSEAARQIGIRHGSEQHHLAQIRARARRLNRSRPAAATFS